MSPYLFISDKTRSYKFRQASDFWYLTGFEEPDSAVILEKNSSPRGYHMTLFSAGKDSAKEQWDGARTSFHDAISYFKMDDAQHISNLRIALKQHGAAASHVYMDVPHSLASVRRGRSPSKQKSTILKVSMKTRDRWIYSLTFR